MDTNTINIPPLPKGFVLEGSQDDSSNSQNNIPPLPDGFQIETNSNPEVKTTLKSIFPDVPVENWVVKGMQETGKDVLAIPAHFFNQLLLNYPRYITEKQGYKYPEETNSKAVGALARTAGVVGAFKNPIFRLLGVTPASSLGKVALAGAVSAGAYAQPLKDRAISAATAAALPYVGKGIATAATKFPAANRAAAGRVINSLIKPLKKNFSFGKNPGQGVAREGIIANNWDDLIEKISLRRNEIGKQIYRETNKVEDMAKIKGVLRPLDVALAKARKAPETNASLINRLEGLRNDLRGIVGGKDIELAKPNLALKMKQQVGDLTKWTGNPSDDKLVNKSLKMVYGRLKRSLEDVVPGIKGLNERYANLTSAEMAARYREELLQRQNLISFPARILSGGSAIYGLTSKNPQSIIASIGFLGLDKVLGSVAFKTRLAKGLMKLSDIEKARVFQAYPTLKRSLTDFMEQPYFKKSVNTKSVLKNKFVNGQKSIIKEAKKHKTAEEFVKSKTARLVKGIDPEKLIFREKEQKNIENIRKAFPKGEGYYPIVVSEGKNGELTILDGHNRASVAIERGDKIDAVVIPSSIYKAALKDGFDEIEIAYASQWKAGDSEAMDALNEQFPGAKVDIEGEKVYDKYFSGDTKETKSKLTSIWNKANSWKGQKSLAIATASGAMLGSRAEASTIGQQNNNPINLKAFEDWEGMAGKDKYGHAKFKTLDHGIRASLKNLKNHQSSNQNQTLIQYMNSFAEENGNNEANFIAKKLGVKVDTKLKDISMERMLIPLAQFESKMTLTANDILRVKRKFKMK